MHEVGAVAGRVRQVEDHGQVVVVHVDRLEGVVRLVGAARDDDGDGLPGEVDRVDGQGRRGRDLHVGGDHPRARQAALLR